TWSRFPFPELAYNWFIVAPMTYSAILAEGLFIFTVWWNRTRLPMLLLISFFHISVGIVLSNVTFFSLSMVCAFMAFLREGDLQKIKKHSQDLFSWFTGLARVKAKHQTSEKEIGRSSSLDEVSQNRTGND